VNVQYAFSLSSWYASDQFRTGAKRLPYYPDILHGEKAVASLLF